MSAASGSADPGAVGKRANLFRHRDFRLFWFGETTSTLGSSITGVALPLVALTTLHSSAFGVSLLSAAAWLPWLLIGLPAGAWVDRLQRRPIMMVADLVSMVAFLSIPVAAWMHRLTLAQLLIVAVLGGIAKVFFQTAYGAFVPAVIGVEDLLEGNAKLKGSESAAQVAGPGVAGVVAQLFGAVGGLVADAASFAISALCLASLRTVEPVRKVVKRTLRTEIREGLHFVIGDPWLRIFAVFGAASNLALTALQAVLVVFLVRTVGLNSGSVGLLMALSSLGGVFGALIARRVARRIGTGRALLLFKVATSPVGLLIPLTTRGFGLIYYVIGTVVLFGGVVAGNVVSSGFSQAYCPNELRGRIGTSMAVLNYGSIPLGAVLGGALATAFGLRPTLWITLTGCMLVTALLLRQPFRSTRELPTTVATWHIKDDPAPQDDPARNVLAG